MKDILIVEDNKALGELLFDFLQVEGYTVQLVKTGEEAITFFKKEEVKLVILDIMLPSMDGFEVCRQIRSESNVPVIVVSAKITKEDKLNGIILGADDYIEKPYDIDILLAKITRIFKRNYSSASIHSGKITLDKEKRIVYKEKEVLSMTTKEFDLLLFLMENKGKVLNKEMIFNKIWGFDSFSEPQTLTVHIKWLREKIEENPKSAQHIITIWGVGYRFE
jgi:Response regulators consisting of a CheY-like receiver domain and a winged-helix DNA-binding domain